ARTYREVARQRTRRSFGTRAWEVADTEAVDLGDGLRMVTLRTDAVRQHHVRSRRDILLERRPGAFLIADPPAIGAHRQQTLELIDLRLEPDDALGDVQSRRHLVEIERLGDKVIRSGLHALEIRALARQRRHHDDVRVSGTRIRANHPAELDPA